MMTRKSAMLIGVLVAAVLAIVGFVPSRPERLIGDLEGYSGAGSGCSSVSATPVMLGLEPKTEPTKPDDAEGGHER
jgi:hypothetical protein